MRVTTEEILHPEQWLRKVLTDEEAFQALLCQSAGLATAAYRLAQAQCRATGLGPRPPTLAELKLAARMIAARTGLAPQLPIDSAERALAARRPRASEPHPSSSGRGAAPTPPSRRHRAAG